MRNVAFLLFFVSIVLNAQLKSPEAFLGYKTGEQFTSHASVVDYFKHVAANSDMVSVAPYGKTYEGRELIYAVVSSPENLSNIETIRLENLKAIGLKPGTAAPKTAIAWFSYNVHGNEASSSEAAMLTLYKVITEKRELLQNTVLIMDPSVNPDGRDRYVNWYKQVKATPYDPSQDAAEHYEPWPGGRANHYLFDLNRDWAWASQTETQQRLKIYNQWMPHVHVDFHEQGINEPYYFAPAAEPFHEIITPWQREFQTQIGKNNAEQFDKNGWLFFTRERFDLLYPSYGDTYPLYMGAIGMTYEQAGHGFAGLGVITDEGTELTLKDRITHHTATGLSTLEMASKNAEKLNEEFKKFFENDDLEYKSFVLKGKLDNITALTKLLDRHEIVYGFTTEKQVKGFNYNKNEKSEMAATGALVVSTNQPKGKMVSVLFEPQTALSTPVTYDITAWSLPYAYGLETVASETFVSANGPAPQVFRANTAVPAAAGYVSKWGSVEDAAFLSALLQNEIKVRFSEKKLGFGGNEFGRGSLLITRSDNFGNPNFDTALIKIADEHQRELYASPSSFADAITDFGSPDVKLVHAPKIALLRGEGTSSVSYGALWHFFEQQLHFPVTSISTDHFENINLGNYSTLILPDGNYGEIITETFLEKIKTWVSGGGKIIAIGGALDVFEGKEGFGLKKNEEEKEGETTEKTDEPEMAKLLIPYAEREMEDVKELITGSIYKINLDASHPLAFGYGDSYFSLKLGSASFAFLEEGYNVGYIKGKPESVSGFSGERAEAALENSLVFGEARLGKGSLVYLVDDVLFRSFWHNGKLFLANALFFVNNNSWEL